MLKTSKVTVWIGAATAAVGGCVLAALVYPVPTKSTAEKSISRPVTEDRSAAARSAREAAAADFTRRVEAWRRYLRSARSPDRLRVFVDELIGIEQKLQQAFEVVQGVRDEQRVLNLFRRRVIDDRQLEADLDATVVAFDQILFEQDREFYEPAGISREEWKQKVHGGWRWTIHWRGHLAPVIERAVSEARGDAVRFVGTQVAADFAGNQIKKMARDAGFDTSESGSLSDFLTGSIVDAGVGIAMDEVTDATDGIVSRLGDEMARAERGLIDGDGGLCWVLRRIEAAHERARNELIAPSTSDQE